MEKRWGNERLGSAEIEECVLLIGGWRIAAGLIRRKDMNSLNQWKPLLLFESIYDLLLRPA